MAKTGEAKAKQVPLVWVGLEDMPVRAANNFIGQVNEELFILTFGFNNTPLIVPGSKEEVAEQVAAIRAVNVTPVARIALTENQVAKTIGSLQDILKRFQAQKK